MTGAAEGADFWAVPPQQEPQQAAARPPRYGARSIADVMTSAAAAIGAEGFDDVLGIPASQRVVVVLVDGLGLEQLEARSSYAPFLRGAEDLGELDAAFPSTTASSLASLGDAGLRALLVGVVVACGRMRSHG